MITSPTSPADLAYQHLRERRSEQALAVIEPVALAPGASHAELAAYATVLKLLTRMDEALAINRRAVAEHPDSPIALHNLAALQGDMDRWEEAEAACRQAIAKGAKAGETWQVLGRALMHQRRTEEAETVLREAIARNGALADAHRDLAQLIWMRTGDREASVAVLRQEMLKRPDDIGLPIQLAQALQYTGAPQEGYQVVAAAVARGRPSLDLHIQASNHAIGLGDGAAALEHARAALMIDSTSIGAAICACDALLQLGEAEQAARLGMKLYNADPHNQALIARLATAWRITGDPRYRQLFDYDALVRPHVIDTPDGWADLPSYLADLAATLKRLHAFETHPFGQSLRGGSQTSQDLTSIDDPVVKAFFKAIDGPIRRHIAALGPGQDVLRRRATGEYAFAGCWSVMLRPNGFHVDHTHPLGWLSSACYIELPDSVDAGAREGWIKFGGPGIATTPVLPPEHFVRPEPGLLVLFPSYMWHGTMPFSGERNRLTIAFDVIPA